MSEEQVPYVVATHEPEDQRDHPFFRMRGRVIAFDRRYVDVTGSVTAALMLSQAVHWTENSSHPGNWFWKTQDQWQEETGMGRREQETARKNLRETSFWQENLRGNPATLWYRVDIDRLQRALLSTPVSMAESAELSMAESDILDWRNAPNKIGGMRHAKRSESTTKNTTSIALPDGNAPGAAFASQKTARVVASKKPVPAPSSPKKAKRTKPQYGQGQLGIDDVDPVPIGEKTSEFKDMAAMVYQILGWNPKLVNQGYHIQVSKLVKQLRDERYTVDSLRDFWNHVWTNDFRWTKHTKHPSLADLRAGIGKLHTPVIAPAAPAKVYGLVQDKDGNYIRREAEDGQLPNGVAQLTPAEVEYYKTPRAKRMGEN